MAEETKTKLLPNIFHLLGLIFLALFSFTGLIYILNGNIGLSSFIAILSVVIAMIIVHYLRVWKAKELKGNRELSSKVPELVLGGFYLILAISLFVINYHYLNIDFYNKNEIKKSALEKITNLENLKKEYGKAIDQKVNTLGNEVERASTNYKSAPAAAKPVYKGQLESILGSGTIDFLPNNPNFDSQVESARLRKENVLRTRYNLDSLDNASVTYLETVKPVFTDWKYLKVSYYYEDIDNFYNLYNNSAKAQMPDFSYSNPIISPYKVNDPVYSLKTSPVSEILLLSLLLIVLHLCILAPYFAANRSQQQLVRNKTLYQRPEGSLSELIK